uniref:Invertebrate defensins family profile domain-containing protein n=1 Tax=Bactrocera latifrons TaxID=174628 RepID=A0A0K8WJY8_BACLA
MRTLSILSVVLCSFLLLKVATAIPVAEAELNGPAQVQQPADPEIVKNKNGDITIDASFQSNAYVEVPGSVAENFLKAMFEAFQKMQISGQTTVHSQVHVPDVKPINVQEGIKAEARAFCNTGRCNSHCFSRGYLGGFCNLFSNCFCY